jgi:hypothetical protein
MVIVILYGGRGAVILTITHQLLFWSYPDGAPKSNGEAKMTSAAKLNTTRVPITSMNITQHLDNKKH